jgi:hypothetical protein
MPHTQTGESVMAHTAGLRLRLQVPVRLLGFRTGLVFLVQVRFYLHLLGQQILIVQFQQVF